MSTPKRDRRLLLIVMVGTCLFFAMTYAGRLARQTALTHEVARWEDKNVQSIARQHALEAELRYIQSDAYVEEIARDEFGMIKPDEEVVVIVPVEEPHEQHVGLEESLTTSEPFWQNWLQQIKQFTGIAE